jgi:hypothetical protein
MGSTAESTRPDMPPPGMRHTDADLTKAIDNAKDQFGVISASGPHEELASLNAADWKRLSQMYSQNNSIQDGFYITDDANGVEIHNDLSQAKAADSRTYSQQLEQDAKDGWSHVVKETGLLTGVSAGVAGLVSADMALTAGEGALTVAAASGGVLALGLGVGGGMIAWEAYSDKKDAKEDLSQGTIKLAPSN